MKKKLMKIINWILNILIIIFAIIVVYVLIDRIFGNSPTDFELMTYILGLYGMTILKLFTLIYGVNREIGELKINVRNGFNKIKEDMKRIENKIDNLSRGRK